MLYEVQYNLRVCIQRTNVACDTRRESELDEEEGGGGNETGYALLERVEERALDRRQVDRAPVDRHEASVARSSSATHQEASADARVGAPRGCPSGARVRTQTQTGAAGGGRGAAHGSGAGSGSTLTAARRERLLASGAEACVGLVGRHLTRRAGR